MAQTYNSITGQLQQANPTAASAGSGGGAAASSGSTDPMQFLNSVLPGIGNLTTSATSGIANLLNGLPSASQARTTNAYWGVGAGQPAGGAGNTGDINSFIGQRGTDLYGQQAAQNQQTGLNELLSTIGSYTSPALTNQGQQLQNNQFGASLNQSGNEFNQSQGQQYNEFGQTLAEQQAEFAQQNQLNQFNSMLSALGLGNTITGQLPGNIQTP